MFTAHKLFSFVFLAAVVSSPLLLRADTPGRHPAYLHARSDLRTAQWLMRVHDDPDVMRRIHQADVEIDRAVHEIDVAASFDHKDLEDHPPIDTSLDRPGRFRKAMELLQRARADIAREEDDPARLAGATSLSGTLTRPCTLSGARRTICKWNAIWVGREIGGRICAAYTVIKIRPASPLASKSKPALISSSLIR